MPSTPTPNDGQVNKNDFCTWKERFQNRNKAHQHHPDVNLDNEPERILFEGSVFSTFLNNTPAAELENHYIVAHFFCSSLKEKFKNLNAYLCLKRKHVAPETEDAILNDSKGNPLIFQGFLQSGGSNTQVSSADFIKNINNFTKRNTKLKSHGKDFDNEVSGIAHSMAQVTQWWSGNFPNEIALYFIMNNKNKTYVVFTDALNTNICSSQKNVRVMAAAADTSSNLYDNGTECCPIG